MDVNVLLFDDFETLDAFGPVEIFGRISTYRLRYFSMRGGMIASRQGVQVLTEPLEQANLKGILLIPGGQGTRPLSEAADFIYALRQIAKSSAQCLTVCTGSALLAKTGLLNGRKATSNKRAFAWVRSTNDSVSWEGRARWVADGKFYTSSGVSAGIDMTLGFIRDRFGRQKAEEIAREIEYIWNSEEDLDLFTAAK